MSRRWRGWRPRVRRRPFFPVPRIGLQPPAPAVPKVLRRRARPRPLKTRRGRFRYVPLVGQPPPPPLGALLFPTMFIIILGPALLNISDMLGGGLGL